MVLGDQVKGMFTHGWRFVVDDALLISQRVRAENRDARLVAYPETGELAVVEWFRREDMPAARGTEDLVKAPIQAQGGTWYLSLRIVDEKGERYCGPPDARVIDQMQRADQNKKPNHKFNVRKFIDQCERLSEVAREQWERETFERMIEPAELEQHFVMKQAGARKPKIYVPRSVAG